jgi:hypothetical protein
LSRFDWHFAENIEPPHVQVEEQATGKVVALLNPRLLGTRVAQKLAQQITQELNATPDSELP